MSYQNASGAVQANLAVGIATGAGGNDTLSAIENVIGLNFDDTLTGSAGVNIITGGLGNDLIMGGLGNDAFVFSLGDGLDTLFDFEQGDLLDAINRVRLGLFVGAL